MLQALIAYVYISYNPTLKNSPSFIDGLLVIYWTLGGIAGIFFSRATWFNIFNDQCILPFWKCEVYYSNMTSVCSYYRVMSFHFILCFVLWPITFLYSTWKFNTRTRLHINLLHVYFINAQPIKTYLSFELYEVNRFARSNVLNNILKWIGRIIKIIEGIL